MAADAPPDQAPAEGAAPQQRRPTLWWKDRPSYRCPACSQLCFQVPKFEAHLAGCCPDVAPSHEWQALLSGAAAASASGGEQAAAAERAAQAQAVRQSSQQAGEEGADGAQHEWALHPADAAIRSWLQVVQQREEASRRRAVSGVSLGPLRALTIACPLCLAFCVI